MSALPRDLVCPFCSETVYDLRPTMSPEAVGNALVNFNIHMAECGARYWDEALGLHRRKPPLHLTCPFCKEVVVSHWGGAEPHEINVLMPRYGDHVLQCAALEFNKRVEEHREKV